jgi:uncharacterized protein
MPKTADQTAKPTASRAGRRETIVVTSSLALMALHVVDDSFLQPQPGTSATDHLVSGLVPLALLAAAALLYPRLRGGARSAVALLAGVFGVVFGSEAIAYTARVGPSGDDFSGFLSLAAGATLVGVGLVTLVRTRRTDGGLLRKSLRRGAWAIGAYLVASALLLPIGAAYVFTHVARTPVEDIDLGTDRVEEVAFTTDDDLKLEGSYVPSRNGAAVIVAFGRKGSQKQARMLVRHGYGVLIFDRRGEGESDGDPNAYAWNEGVKDLDAAVAFVARRPDVDPRRIGALGLSVGGESLLQAAARNEAFRAVVSEGASTRSSGELASVPGTSVPVIFGTAMTTLGTAVFSDAQPPPHLIDLVDEIAPRGVFFIHSHDGTAGEERRFNPAFYREAGAPKQIWEVPDSGHVGGIDARPREYEARVTAFFDRHLAP